MIYSRDENGSVRQILGSITDIAMPEKSQNCGEVPAEKQ
jgi:hypothetical protein